MSLKLKIILSVIGLLLLAPFVFDMLTVWNLSWAEVQKFGGVRVEKPLDTENGYYMPIVCNVSGTDSITVKPTAISSFYKFKRTKVSIKDHMIYIRISSCGSSFGGDGTWCKAVKLGKLEHGHYLVYYETGELIGEFYI